MFLNRQGITYEEACEKLESLPLLKKTIKKDVLDSLGYVLAEDIKAGFSLPAFRRSGYDGYGIVKEDDTDDFPKVFDLVEEIGAGEVSKNKILPGQTLRIMTGAHVPDEITKVIMLEVTKKDGQKVTILKNPLKSNITPEGAEFKKGATLLTKGTTINPGVVSLLSAFGYRKVAVYQKPKVAILTTGSELLKAGDPYVKGKIYNSNGPLLKSLVEENGGEVVIYTTIEDDLEKTRQQLKNLAEKIDFVISSGGVSVGDYDFMAVLAKESDELYFNKLNMRPGSPTTVYRHNQTPIFALSGNPGACFTGFYLFVEPYIQKCQGQMSKCKKTKKILASDYTKTNEFDKYLRGTFEDEIADFSGSDQSSALGNLPVTTCLIKVPHQQILKKGEVVDVWILPYKS